MTEADLRRVIRENLRALGWLVVDTSDRRRTGGGLRRLPDILAWRLDHLLLLETKAERGRVRPGQAEFADELEPHTGPHVRYLVPRSWKDVAEVIDNIQWDGQYPQTVGTKRVFKVYSGLGTDGGPF